MTKKQLLYCVREVPEYSDIDAYVSDLALSSMWEDDPDDDIPQERIDDLRAIYTAWTMPWLDAIHALGLTQQAFADLYGVSKRTVETWCMNLTTPPGYAKILLLQDMGLLPKTKAEGV